jgi:long-subunit fatty acid transport protein
VKLTSRLALGASLNLWHGDWTIDAYASQTALDGTDPEFLRVSEAHRVRGENVSAGLMLTYPRWSTGLVYQSPLHSDYNVSSSSESTRSPPATEQLDGTIRFARGLGLGGAWRPSPRWTVALDLTWDDWSASVVESAATGPVSLFDGLPADSTSTRDTLSLNAGAERLFHGEGFVVPLRFGVAWEPQGGRSPYTRDPVDYVMLAAGTGYNTNSLKFDAALQYRWTSYWDGASFGLEPLVPSLPAAVGERSVTEWRLKFSLILRITDTDKLRRTIVNIFS